MARNLSIAAGCLVVVVFLPCAMAQSSRAMTTSAPTPDWSPSLSRYPMAKKPKASTTARTTAKNAGKPVMSRRERSAAARAGPSDEELDLRDRLKAGPRRQAGPPLSGDTPERARMRALRDEVVPDPTDPKEP